MRLPQIQHRGVNVVLLSALQSLLKAETRRTSCACDMSLLPSNCVVQRCGRWACPNSSAPAAHVWWFPYPCLHSFCCRDAGDECA